MQEAGTGGRFSNGVIVARFFAIADNAPVRRKQANSPVPCKQLCGAACLPGATSVRIKQAHVKQRGCPSTSCARCHRALPLLERAEELTEITRILPSCTGCKGACRQPERFALCHCLRASVSPVLLSLMTASHHLHRPPAVPRTQDATLAYTSRMLINADAPFAAANVCATGLLRASDQASAAHAARTALPAARRPFHTAEAAFQLVPPRERPRHAVEVQAGGGRHTSRVPAPLTRQIGGRQRPPAPSLSL